MYLVQLDGVLQRKFTVLFNNEVSFVENTTLLEVC